MIPEITAGGAAAIYSAAAGGAVSTLTIIGLAVKYVLLPYVKREITGPLRETHHQVSVNSHSSAEPTLKDLIDDVKTDARQRIDYVREDVGEVRERVAEVKAQVGAVRETQAQVGDDLKAHLTESNQERLLRTREQLALWNAIEAIAKAPLAPPIEEDRHGNEGA